LSGTIRPDDHLVNSRAGSDERLHGVLTLRGHEQEPATDVPAGDIAAVAKLSATSTGDTLAPRGKPVSVPGIEPPSPLLSVAIHARTQADDDKLATALHRLGDEDPALFVERNDETGQTLLKGQGETHLQITMERLARKFGVEVDTDEVRVPYRETITTNAEAEGKHKKQTGGHGQFGVAFLRVAPLPRGEGFRFVDKIVGGAIPRQYIPAVQKGIEETMQAGGVFGYPVVDVEAELFDGKYHSVDSSEMAFKAAGRLAFKAALAAANPVLLEPISRIEVMVPADLQGDVMGDLNSRRGQIQGAEAGPGEGEQTVIALVPTAEIMRYAIDLRSITGGRGRFALEHDHYDVVPQHLVAQVARSSNDEA
jgi:elongation factor G